MAVTHEIAQRHLAVYHAEQKLRQHVGQLAPLKLITHYSVESNRWEVALKLLPEGKSPVMLGSEPLDEFPSELMIAQAMLVL